jgi:hypothetical protein
VKCDGSASFGAARHPSGQTATADDYELEDEELSDTDVDEDAA